MLMGSESTTTTLIALVLVAVGGAVGQIITAPFSAGVVVLLYTDRRIRAEAFDLVLQTGAAIAAPVRRRTRPTTCGSPGSPDVPAIDIDRDAAHEAAQRELAKPIYPKASLTERLSEWLDDLLYRIAQEGSRLPGGWFTVTVLLIMVAIAIVVAVRIARRTMRTNRGGEHALFDSHELTAAHTARPPNDMRRRAIGRPPSAIASEPSRDNSRKTACSTPCRAERRPSSRGTPERPFRFWAAN